jgi:hypothetical protein
MEGKLATKRKRSKAAKSVKPRKESATRKTSTATPSVVEAADAPRRKRDTGSVITDLDLASLDDAAITDILLHAASALALRKISPNPEASRTRSAIRCYTKAADSPIVTVWERGRVYKDMPESEALANGYLPCDLGRR